MLWCTLVMFNKVLYKAFVAICGIAGAICLPVGVLLSLSCLGENWLLTCLAFAFLLAGIALLEFALRHEANGMEGVNDSLRRTVPGPGAIDVLALQAIIFMLFALLCDGGLGATACFYSYLGYGAGALLVLARRAKKLTVGDVYYLRWAWVPIVAVGVPLFLHVWRAKGLIG